MKKSPTKPSSNRYGIALVSAVALLALLGLLLVGAVASASMAHRALGASLSDGSLLGAADYAIGEALSDPSRFGLADLALQHSQTSAVPVPGAAQIRATLSATRLPSGLYWLVGRSESGDADVARRRVAVIARTAWVGPPPSAPFVSRGSTQLSADVAVLPDTLSEPDCAVSGLPDPVQTADSITLFQAAGQWAALAAASGVLATTGDTTITGGSFDGILMVAGNLVIDGPFDMTGLIVARGTVRSTVGFHLRGSLLSQAGFPASIDLHGATVRYAPCVVSRLLRRASPLRAVRVWGWSELF
jgi:hypothetical protein